jgi:deoxyuridine 5'-triphosphate nucleotidohydrolase
MAKEINIEKTNNIKTGKSIILSQEDNIKEKKVLTIETENDIKKMKFQIDPHRDVLIPSGVHVNIPKDKVLIAFNKSGVATKNKLTIGACVIDSDYQGEVHIHLINQSDKSIVLEEDQKIAQFVLVDAWHGSPKEVKFEELYGVKTERGVGGFGSTNK